MGFTLFTRVISLVALALSVSASDAAAQDVATAYRERFILVGELLRARAVCAENKQDAEWLVESAAAINSPELKAYSRSFEAQAWMDEGAGKLNDKVLVEGVPDACEFAKAEGARALRLAKEPLPPQQKGGDSEKPR